MKTLYQVITPYNQGQLFFWAESEEEALELAHQQGLGRELEARAERVWANNVNLEYRGYVVEK